MANSKRQCKQCKEFNNHETMVRIMGGWFCNLNHAAEWGEIKQKKHRETVRKQINRDQKKINRAKKDSLKTQRDYLKTTQVSANAYVRCRDDGKSCISCGSLPEQKRGGTMDAGHYRSRGAASHLRFNTLNIHAQCVKCNRFNSGNAVDYRINLIKKIGLGLVEGLENDNSIRSFSIEYLKRFTKIFNKRKRHLIKLRTMLESTK